MSYLLPKNKQYSHSILVFTLLLSITLFSGCSATVSNTPEASTHEIIQVAEKSLPQAEITQEQTAPVANNTAANKETGFSLFKFIANFFGFFFRK